MKTKFDILDIVTAALVAYRHNENQIVRVQTDDRFPNRQLIAECSAGNHINMRSPTSEDRKTAEAMIDYLQQVGMVQTLIGRDDNFLNQVNSLITQGQVTTKEFGILAWVPKLTETYQQRDAVKEITARFGRGSQYIGRIGDKITIDFTLIEDHYIRSLECYAVFGRDQYNNFVTFWAKDKSKIIKQGAIRARVKDHKRDAYHGDVLVTQLHYVKNL